MRKKSSIAGSIEIDEIVSYSSSEPHRMADIEQTQTMKNNVGYGSFAVQEDEPKIMAEIVQKFIRKPMKIVYRTGDDDLP